MGFDTNRGGHRDRFNFYGFDNEVLVRRNKAKAHFVQFFKLTNNVIEFVPVNNNRRIRPLVTEMHRPLHRDFFACLSLLCQFLPALSFEVLVNHSELVHQVTIKNRFYRLMTADNCVCQTHAISR